MSKKKRKSNPVKYVEVPEFVTVERFANLMGIDMRSEQWTLFLKYGSSVVPMTSEGMVRMLEIPRETKSARRNFRKTFAKSLDYCDIKAISKNIGLNIEETKALLDSIEDAEYIIDDNGEHLYNMGFVDSLEHDDRFVDALKKHDERLAANRKKKHDAQLAALNDVSNGETVRMKTVVCYSVF